MPLSEPFLQLDNVRDAASVRKAMPSYERSLQLDDLTETVNIRKPAPIKKRTDSPQPSTSALSKQKEKQIPTMPHRTTDREHFQSPVIPNQNTNNKVLTVLYNSFITRKLSPHFSFYILLLVGYFYNVYSAREAERFDSNLPLFKDTHNRIATEY